MKSYALLGGPETVWPLNIKNIFFKAKMAGDLLIGVDRGSLLLNQMGIIADLAVGDFDSLKKSELTQIEKNVPDIRYSNPIKDLTDSQLMIRVAFNEYQVDSLIIFGATGGRIDHFLVNLLMLLDPAVKKYAEKVTLIDQQNIIKFYLPGKHIVKREVTYPYFGVVNLYTVKDLNILKAKYTLKNFSANYPFCFASNEYAQNQDYFELNFKSGFVAVIFSKDIDRFQVINNSLS